MKILQKCYNKNNNFSQFLSVINSSVPIKQGVFLHPLFVTLFHYFYFGFSDNFYRSRLIFYDDDYRFCLLLFFHSSVPF